MEGGHEVQIFKTKLSGLSTGGNIGEDSFHIEHLQSEKRKYCILIIQLKLSKVTLELD